MQWKLKTNDTWTKVEIVDSYNNGNFERHTVRLLEPLGNFEAGTIIEECYSHVSAATQAMYGIKQDLFPCYQ